MINEDIIFYAFRYALGRSTSAPFTVVNYIINEGWKQLDKVHKSAMKKEIESAIENNEAGMQMDVEQWKKILELEVK